MKICFFIDTIFIQGGVSRVITTLANELSKFNSVDIVCTATKVPIDYGIYKLNANSVNIIYKPMKVNFAKKVYRRILKNLNYRSNILNSKNFNQIFCNAMFPKDICKDFTNFFNGNNYDVIIGSHIFFSMFLGKMAEKLDSKTIGWQHNSFKCYFSVKNKYAWNQEYLFKSCLSKLDEVIVQTDDDKRLYKKYLNIEAKRIYNPNSFESKFTSNLDNKNFLAVGRLVEEKGFDLLIEAFKLFNQENKEWKLIIVGQGPKDKILNALIIKNKLQDFVEIRPFTRNIKKYYLESSVYLLSSRLEGWGLAWIEAMTCGLPIVTYNLPVVKEVVREKKVGFLVEQENIYKFSLAMLKISNDYNKLKIKSKNAIELANKFNAKKISLEWTTLFKKLIRSYDE